MNTVTPDGILWVEKDKDSRLNYSFRLDQVLSVGDTVASVTAEVAPTGGVVIDGEPVLSGAQVSVVLVGGAIRTWYTIKFRWTSAAGISDEFALRVFVRQDDESTSMAGSALFPNRFSATAQLRRDRLMAAASSVLPGTEGYTDDYVWEKLVAAESEVKHVLRVPLCPTKFFPRTPTAEQIDALAGMPWEVDPGYDYEPDFFASDAWGHMQLRNKPLIDVESATIVFPGSTGTYTIPPSWMRMDKRYGQLQFIPTAAGQGSIPLHAFMLQAIGMGRKIPFAIEVAYTAGLEASQFPELLDIVRKKAVLSLIEDLFLPTSGSISADGLSQSISSDMDKYRDTIDHALNGPKGRNGGLVAAIHGVRMGFA